MSVSCVWCVLILYFFFFFKQKTAYEMRISDWSSDVCSSDLNSAYPYALSNAPSLGIEHGEWRYIERPSKIEEFGVYHIRYRNEGKPRLFEYRAMPLFHRDNRGAISFPTNLEGWYWSRSEERRVGKEGVSACESRGGTIE